MTHRTKLYINQACQTGGPPATFNSWMICLICQKSAGVCEDNSFKGHHEIQHLFTSKCKTDVFSELQSSSKSNKNYSVRITTQYEQREI